MWEMVRVTTFSVDDQLYHSASEAAAAKGQTVDEFIGEVLQRAVATVGTRQTLRNGLPVMVVRCPSSPIDPAAVRRAIEEEGF